MKASELFAAEPWLKVLLYGPSGSGKTTWAATAPRPLVVLTERQGLASVVGANPDADVVLVESYEQFCSLVQAIVRGHSTTIETETGQQRAYEFQHGDETFTVQTVVLDSLTDLHERARKAYDIGDGDVDWRSVQGDVQAFMDDLRSAPVNLVTIALAEDKMDDQGRRRVSPLLYGRTSYLVGQWHSATGYAVKRERDGAIEHGIAWQLGSGFDSKPAPGFPKFTVSAMSTTPGNVTLGSLVLASFGTGAHETHDSADFVTAQTEAEMEREKIRRDKREVKQTTARPKRRG